MSRYLILLLLLLMSACSMSDQEGATPSAETPSASTLTPSVSPSATEIPPSATLSPTLSPTLRPTRRLTATETPTSEPTADEKRADEGIQSVCLLTDVSDMGDSTINELAKMGILKANTLQTKEIEVEFQPDDSQSLEPCLETGSEVVITVGFQMTEATLTAAKANPALYFIGVDQYFEEPPDNLVGIYGREDQGGFLAGALACMMTELDSVVGIYARPNIPPWRKYLQGFLNGCHYVHPQAIVKQFYLSDTSAKKSFSSSADVVFGIGWQTSSASVRFKSDMEYISIYVDPYKYKATFNHGDIYSPGQLLTTIFKHVDDAVYKQLQAYEQEKPSLSAGGSSYVMELANGGISYSDFDKAEGSIPFKVQLCFEAIYESLANGSLKTGVDSVTGQAIADDIPKSVPFRWSEAQLPYELEASERIKISCLTPNSNSPNAFIPPQEAPMVVVPAGEFLMGSTLGQVEAWKQRWISYIATYYSRCQWAPCHRGPRTDELYQFTGYLEQFEIEKFEVTNHQYQLCVEAGTCSPEVEELPVNPLLANHPVTNVTQQQAATYCRWVGKRLPTEAEWEKAARGTDGRIYPWGNDWDQRRLNIGPTLMPVGSFPTGASPYGAFDMAGNASEWTSDTFEPYPGKKIPDRAALFAPIGKAVYRGGQIRSPGQGLYFPLLFLRSATRYDPSREDYFAELGPQIGFRCAQGPEQKVKVISNPAAAKPLATQTTVDLSDMLLVPAGEFIMGTDDFDDSYKNESPAHQVYLDAFYIDKYEVTAAQYAEFLNLYGQHEYACNGVNCLDLHDPITKKDGRYQAVTGQEKHPIEVSWYGADLYCQWLGKRLPTEAEWEKAARGTDGRKYPWGNEQMPREAIGYWGSPEAVGTHPVDQSPYGLFDMFGNAEEWMADWYDEDYYTHSPSNNPTGPEEPVRYEDKSVRSGNISHMTERSAYPLAFGVGFRCAISQ